MMQTRELVLKSAEAILELNSVSQLLGGSVFVEGVERIMIQSAIRQRVTPDNELLAFNLADFIPIAFSRVTLADSGVVFFDHFVRVDAKNRIRQYSRLDNEVIFRDARLLALEWMPVKQEDALAIAALSCEDGPVRKKLADGGKASNLQLGPVVLNGPEELCPPLSEQPNMDPSEWWMAPFRVQKPWWKFWG